MSSSLTRLSHACASNVYSCIKVFDPWRNKKICGFRLIGSSLFKRYRMICTYISKENQRSRAVLYSYTAGIQRKRLRYAVQKLAHCCLLILYKNAACLFFEKKMQHVFGWHDMHYNDRTKIRSQYQQVHSYSLILCILHALLLHTNTVCVFSKKQSAIVRTCVHVDEITHAVCVVWPLIFIPITE
jgi:hypothetical protein